MADLERTKEEIKALNDEIESLSSKFANQLNLDDLDESSRRVADRFAKDISKSTSKIVNDFTKQDGILAKINQKTNASKDISKEIIKNEARKNTLLRNADLLRKQGVILDEESLALLVDAVDKNIKNLNVIKEKNIAAQKERDFLNEGLEKLKEQYTATRLARLALVAVGKAILDANKSVTELQKQLGISTLKATGLRFQLSAAAFSANDLRVTTETLIGAQTELNKGFQTAALFSNEIAVGAASALDAQLMSGEAVSQLAGDAARLGQTFDESLKTQENAVNAINSQTGAQISLQTVLEASNQVSGQIRAQLGANPEAIARAVTQAKALGFELEQIAASGEALLNFESSIENELQAELLTGKQLNLERARLAALTGDLETLTSEISANVGDFNDFTSMNVLQQQAIASAVGMTADELANSLITEENRAQLLQDAIASGNDQSVQQLKALDTQEKFAKVLEQAKGLLIDIATIFSPIVDVIGLMAEGMGHVVGKILLVGGALASIIPLYKTLKGLQLMTSIGAIFQSNAKFGPLGIAASLAGVLTMVGAINKFATADDMAYGNNMLVTKNKGTIALNNNDSVIAGTNLLGGGEREKFDYNKMASAMSQVQISTSTVYDSFSSKNQSSNHGSYQSDARHKTRFA